MSQISLFEIQCINAERCKRWHSQVTQQWSVLEWAGAMCGEAGEAANLAKKLRRFEQGLDGNQSSERKYADAEEISKKLGEEIADTILYALLLASHCGINAERAVVEKFNAKSLAQGFPERLD